MVARSLWPSSSPQQQRPALFLPSSPSSSPIQKPKPVVLRPYQREGIDTILSWYERGFNKLVVELPTGAGKTLLALILMKELLTPWEHGLFVVPSILLATQTYRVACSLFPTEQVGLVQAENDELGRRITIATVDTLNIPERREALLASILGRKFSCVVIDEAQGSICDSYFSIVEDLLHPYGLLLGMSATPWRLDGKSLQRLFSSLSHPAFYVDMLDLIAQKHLVPVKPYKIETDLNLEDINLDEGQWNREEEKALPRQLARRLQSTNRYEQAYIAWTEIIQCQRTLIFADSVPDAFRFRDYFLSRGDGLCAVVTGRTPNEQRAEIHELFRMGTLPIIAHFNMYHTGVDFPEVVAAIIGRFSFMGDNPNTALHQQAIGRLMRPYPGKDHAIAVYLTTKRYPHVPIILSMGLLPGSLTDSTGGTQRGAPPSPSIEQELAEEETVKEEEEEEDQDSIAEPPAEEQEIYLRLKRLKVEQTSLFAGEGWEPQFDQSFTKITPYGTLIAERSGSLDTYQVSLQSKQGRTYHITERPVPIEEALARGVQYVVREQAKDRMRHGERTEASEDMVTDGMKRHLDQRKGLDLPRNQEDKQIEYNGMTQGVYYQIVQKMEEREQAPRAKGTPYPMIYWRPGERVRSYTPQRRSPRK